MVALKDLLEVHGSSNVFTEEKFPTVAGGSGVRANYLFNTTVAALEDADLFLVVGCNPRYEAPVLNARIRKAWVHNDADVAYVGTPVDLAYSTEHLGETAQALADLAAGKGAFAKRWQAAKKPVLVVGSSTLQRPDADAIFALCKNVAATAKPEAGWRVMNVLQRNASQVAALDLGYKATGAPAGAAPKLVYLLGADSVPQEQLKGAFVVYQGSHGDRGASMADVVLPGAAYTEKDAVYVNLEGRAQSTRRAVTPPGQARDDWKIIRALSEFCGAALPYDKQEDVRGRLGMVAPHMVQLGHLAAAADYSASKVDGTVPKPSAEPLTPAQKTLKDFYMTDAITRASQTMAKCVQAASQAK